VSAIRDAVARLESSGTIQLQLDRWAFVGHSMGAIMSANIAQNADRHHLPTPRCLFLAEPAFEPILGRYDQIPPETLLVVVVGNDVKRDPTAERILAGTIRIAASNKNYVALLSDLHGSPPLISDHFAPCAVEDSGHSESRSARNEWRGRTRDTLDYFGYWKICDGLLDAAFHGTHREFALGDTPEVRFMGKWSDGTPVEPAIILPITTDP
jgi:pimeloyl-ACP methyl ester carboxylesterase